MTGPVQVALRELLFLTKCYCAPGEHPRLGHNCSFRPDVERVVAALSGALGMCNDAIAEGGPDPWGERMVSADEIRRTLLGLPPTETSIADAACEIHGPHPMTADCVECTYGENPLVRAVEEETQPHSARLAARLQEAAAQEREQIRSEGAAAGPG